MDKQRKKRIYQRRVINIGDKFKHWTVIDGPKLNKYRSYIYLAECDCKRVQRWFQANALTKVDGNFQCNICAGKARVPNFTAKHGRVGELTQNKYGKLQRVAKQRNLEFNLSKEYLWDLFLKQNRVCAITGDYLEDIKKSSLDRIDSSIGYIEGNVQWVTFQANVSKHIMTMNEFIEFCTKVLNHANQQPSQS